MKATDWLSERMVALVLLFTLLGVISILAIVMLSGPAPKDPLTVGLFSSLIAGLLSSLGAMVNSIFRVDRTDRIRAETANTMASTLAAATPTAPTPVQPVQVVNEPSEPVPTAPQEPTP